MFQEKPTINTANPIIVKAENETINDFRKNYPAEYRTKDGHYVRSKAELTIDDSLYLWGIPHAYEKKLPNTDENVYSDFHIPSGKGRQKAVYIEYWGMEYDEKYNKRKNKNSVFVFVVRDNFANDTTTECQDTNNKNKACCNRAPRSNVC